MQTPCLLIYCTKFRLSHRSWSFEILKSGSNHSRCGPIKNLTIASLRALFYILMRHYPLSVSLSEGIIPMTHRTYIQVSCQTEVPAKLPLASSTLVRLRKFMDSLKHACKPLETNKIPRAERHSYESSGSFDALRNNFPSPFRADPCHCFEQNPCHISDIDMFVVVYASPFASHFPFHSTRILLSDFRSSLENGLCSVDLETKTRH